MSRSFSGLNIIGITISKLISNVSLFSVSFALANSLLSKSSSALFYPRSELLNMLSIDFPDSEL